MGGRPVAHRSGGLTIGIVCPYSFSTPGGVQNHVLGLAGWLSAHGHRVHIFGPGAPDPAALHAVGLAEHQFTSAGGAVAVRYNGSVARISFGPLEAARVRAWLRRINPDLLHVHEPITPSVSMLAVWNATCPMVATFHTATPGSRAMAVARRLLPRTITAVRHGIAVSSVAQGVVHDHIGLVPRIIGNGISLRPRPDDLDRTTWRGGDHPTIGFVGRFDEPRKGFDVFTRALPQVRHRFANADVVVIGDGTPRSAPGVRFTGYVDDAARDAALAAIDVYVAPHTGRESFGIVILEALAAGADVVASDLPAFREVLTDRHGMLVGRLARTGDHAQLAQAIIAALERPDPAPRTAGYDHAATFDWSRVGSRVLAVYHEALSARSTPVRRR
ncbi:glycosyltransferase family 4 protein [Propionibacteriaceae bacterium G1746]|uniref:glycosyltransferase family 4 protein n=1 Tax=Aestuariimicrobium sp. G57 TaxID=3418485 RepID=UPI003D3D5778